MQDRFKFRAYNFLSKKYTYFDEPEVQFAERDSVYLCGIIMPLLDEKQSLYFGKYELQQCTGLKDKNGKLIYEGDIVRESFGETGTYRVEYFPYSAEWQYLNLDDEKPNWEMFSMQFEGMSENQGISTDLEIIGNIYENPELIGGAEC